MEFTGDEFTTIIEALREYRVRTDASRRVLCEALIYRFGAALVDQAKQDFLTEEPDGRFGPTD